MMPSKLSLLFSHSLAGESSSKEPCYSLTCVSRAIAIPIGETIFVHSLSSEISKHTPEISGSLVVHVGPTNLKSLTTDSSTLRSLRASYSQAVTDVIYFSTAALAVALPFALFMEWRNIKALKDEPVVGFEVETHAECESSTKVMTLRNHVGSEG